MMGICKHCDGNECCIAGEWVYIERNWEINLWNVDFSGERKA